MSIEVRREPLTYDLRSPHSYFLDRLQADDGSNEARARLQRHAREIDDELERRHEAAERERRAAEEPGGRLEGAEYEQRANPSRTQGQGGYFSPPLWLIDRFASAPRAPRVLARLIAEAGGAFALPQGAQSVNVPRLTTGTAAATVNDDGAVPGQDIVDAQVTSPVVTIAGQLDTSMQLLEQSPPGAHLDWAVFRDLNQAYDAQLEAQLINGSGTNGQLTGLLALTLPSANTVTYTSGTPAATAMFTFFGQMVAAVGNNRKQPPEAWLMTTSRSAWLAASEDTQSRPLMLANTSGEPGEWDLVTYPVRPDDAIPTTVSGNQDRVLLCKPSDHLLLESDAHIVVATEPLSGTLQARLQLHRYAAALLGRYPSGTAVLNGTGTVVQAGY